MMKGMVFAERYKLEEFIGQGGMSLVYRAVDIRTGHSVAVKILKSEYNSDKEFLERCKVVCTFVFPVLWNYCVCDHLYFPFVVFDSKACGRGCKGICSFSIL